jgi:hypothetical protein
MFVCVVVELDKFFCPLLSLLEGIKTIIVWVGGMVFQLTSCHINCKKVAS